MKTLVKQIAGIPIGMIFCLAMIPLVIVHRLVVVAKLPVSVDKLIIRVYAILEAMTDNAWFPTPPIDDVKAAVGELKDAQLLAKTRAAGTSKNRNVKKSALLNAMIGLLAYVQGIMIANPESAAAIAESALLFVKKVSGGVKKVFTVFNYKSGSVELSGLMKGKICLHEWQMSLDPTDAHLGLTPDKL